jgi:hypothetical protein
MGNATNNAIPSYLYPPKGSPYMTVAKFSSSLIPGQDNS